MAIPRRATRMFRSLRAERRTLRQGLVALVLSTVAGFIAGLTLSGIGDTLKSLPGLIILIPAAVGMRGTIFGAIGARLGTTNAAGTFEVSFGKDGVLYQNVYVAVVTTFGSALWLAVLAKVAASAFGRTVDLDLEPDHHLGGRRGARLRLHPVGDGGSVDPVLPTRVGPGLGIDADGHRARRHGHAPDAVPRDVPGPQRDRERGRVRHLPRGGSVRDRSRVHGERLDRAARDPRDDRGDPPDADPRHLVGRAAGAPAHGADGGPRPADPDPAVRVAGGRPGRDLLVPNLIEAADRCHHAPRAAREPRARGRHHRVRARRRGVLADRRDRGRAGGAHRSGAGLTRARRRLDARGRPHRHADHDRVELLPRDRDVSVRSGPRQPDGAHHHERHGPGRGRLRSLRYVSIWSAAAMDDDNPRTSKSSSSS